MGIRSIDYEKSRTLKVPASWLFFVLINPDILSIINNAPLSLSPGEAERTFKGKIWGAKVHLTISGDREPKLEGIVDILANVRFFSKTHTFVRYKYRSIDIDTSLVELKFCLTTTGIIMLGVKLFRQNNIDAYLKQVLSQLEKAGAYLAQDNPELGKILSPQQLERVNKYRENLQNNPQQDVTATAKSPISINFGDKVWDRELQDLLILHNEYQGEIDTLKEEVNRIIDARDEVGTLLYARRTLEIIVSHLCTVILKRPRGKDPLAKIIDLLQKSKVLPDNVCTSMKNLNSLGNYGAHPKDFSPRQVREALSGLCSIMEWYVKIDESALDKTDSPTLRYKEMCKKLYENSIPSIDMRRKMERERKELGLSEAEAAAIERNVIPAEIRELQVAVETIYVDGKINEQESLFLNAKAEQLGIAPELAKKIIEEYCGKMENSLTAKYRALCQRMYYNSIPTEDQHNELENERKRLGITIEEAREIEEECIPQKIKLLKIAIETIYLDGKIDDSDKKFLDSKAQELKINPDLAVRIIDEYCKKMEDSLEAKYLNICQSLYVKSVPTPEQKKTLEKERIKLGLSTEDAIKIESQCISDNVREYISALEGVYSDGKVRRKEREFLDKKAAQLDITPELAKQLESQIENSPQIRYRIHCNGLYSNSIPTKEQRKILEEKQKEFGLSKREAEEIEKGCIPDKIQDYQSALEGVYADGDVRESERAFLNERIKTLGLNQDLAIQIEEYVKSSR